MQKLFNSVFSLLILVSPCTGILALGPWLRLPILVFLLVLLLFPIFSLPEIKKYNFHLDKFLLIIFLFLSFSFLSLLFNYQGSKNITNWLPYPWLFIGNYLFIRFLIRNNMCGISIESVLSVSQLTYLIIGSFILFDFVLVNFTGIQIRTVLVNLNNGTANMDYYFRSNIINTGGVAEEPGIMSMMMNIFFFLTLYFSRNKKRIFIICLYIFHAAILISLGSTMGIFSFLISQILINWTWKINLLIIGTVAAIFIVMRSLFLDNPFIQEMVSKAMLSEDLESSYVRVTLWKTAYEAFLNKPWLGAGPGFGKFLAPDGFMSFVLILLAELGVICFGLLVWFIAESYKKASVIAKFTKSNALKMGVICSTLHVAVINEYYHLPFWLLLAIVYCLEISVNNAPQILNETKTSEVPEIAPV